MPEFEQLLHALAVVAWPLALYAAWLLAHAGRRWLGVPRVTVYAVVGLVASAIDLPRFGSQALIGQLADVAAALLIFELGRYVNLRWFARNPWLSVTAVAVALGSFLALLAAALALSVSLPAAIVVAAVASASSPVALITIINDQRASGQVAERSLHLCAVTVVTAVLLLRLGLGFEAMRNTDQWWQVLRSGAAVLVGSIAFGWVFGQCMPVLRRVLDPVSTVTTVHDALALAVLATVATSLQMSAFIAALVFGLVSRHGRTVPTVAQRNFGMLGELAAMFLVVATLARIEFALVVPVFATGVALVVVRVLVMTLICASTGRPSGTTWRKGALTGLALSPMPAFMLVLLFETGNLAGPVINTAAGVVGAMLIVLELFGPILTQWALRAAAESESLDAVGTALPARRQER